MTQKCFFRRLLLAAGIQFTAFTAYPFSASGSPFKHWRYPRPMGRSLTRKLVNSRCTRLAITVNSATQRPGTTDELQQLLVILFSGGFRVMEPDIKSGPGNLENPTHCNERPDFTVIVDKAILQSGSPAKYRAAFFRISRSSSVRLSCAFSLRISVLASSKPCVCCPVLSGLTSRSHL